MLLVQQQLHQQYHVTKDLADPKDIKSFCFGQSHQLYEGSKQICKAKVVHVSRSSLQH